MINFKKRLVTASILSPLIVLSATNGTTQAQETEASLEEVVVLGSRIKRKSQAATSTPLSSFGSDDLKNIGAKDTRDLIQTLTINAGSQNNSDNLSQNFTVGTSNVNLRGLGVASTLVLLNGKRQVTSSVVTDEGSSFVDTASLVPNLAIERVDILKDGASALYGSDAVAGVANFVTRDSFNGVEIELERRSRTSSGSQDDTNIDFVYGGDVGESGHILLAASYLDRSSLLLDETDFLVLGLEGSSTSGFGNPGTFRLPDGSIQADPNCEANGGFLSGGFCRFDFGPQVTAVPDESRLQGFARANWDWNDNTTAWAEIGFARNNISREVSPSFPVLNTPTIPANNPGNPFGVEVDFFSRPFGVGQPTEINLYDHTTTRFATGLEGEFSDSLFWDLSFVRAANDAVQNPRDVIASNYQAALNGFGGINCDAANSAPGTNGCLFFNPTSINDPVNQQLRSFIIGDYIGDTESELTSFEGTITGNELFSLPGGSAGFALGFQYREESLIAVYDSVTQQDGFAFLIGNTNFSGERDVTAIFGEILLPLAENLEVSAAVRYEDYGGGVGDTTDPKLSILWTPKDYLSFRGSIGTSFRAPSVHQLLGAQTNFANISDPNNGGSSTFGGNRTIGNPNLEPEESTAFNLGVSWSIANWELDFDYWDFAFEDVLTRENAQEIVNLNPNDPARVERTSAGTIAIVNTNFINSTAIDTSGFDFNARAFYDSRFGTFAPSFSATYVTSYDITTADGTVIDGAGALNRANVGNPTPELRANIGLNWIQGVHSANIFYRYIDSYERNEVSNTDSIDSFDQIDIQYNVSLGSFLREDSTTSLSVGVVNLFDEDPPFVAIAGSYDPRTGDPRGQRVYVKLGLDF